MSNSQKAQVEHEIVNPVAKQSLDITRRPTERTAQFGTTLFADKGWDTQSKLKCLTLMVF